MPDDADPDIDLFATTDADEAPALTLPLIPHGDHLLVAPVEEDTPAASLLLPASYRRAMPTRKAVVLAVGEGLRRDDGTVLGAPAAGDLILHKRHAGTDVLWNGHKLMVMHRRDVLSVLRDDDAETAA